MGTSRACCPQMASHFEFLLKHSVKQVMPVSLSCRCHVQAVFVENNLQLRLCLLHQPVVHVVSA